MDHSDAGPVLDVADGAGITPPSDVAALHACCGYVETSKVQQAAVIVDTELRMCTKLDLV